MLGRNKSILGVATAAIAAATILASCTHTKEDPHPLARAESRAVQASAVGPILFADDFNRRKHQ